MKVDEGKLLMLSLGVLTGILVTSFISKTSINPKHTVIMTTQQYQNMNMQLNELQYEIKGLYKEYDDLQLKYNTYSESTEHESAVYNTVNQEIKNAKLFYGSVDVEGPGIKIIVNDNNDTTDETNVHDSITHDFDIYNLINDLKAGGAEAISVNGNRIVDTTSVTCEGPIIKINKNYAATPFEILAIGDPDTLVYQLSQPESYYTVMKIRGLKLNLQKFNNIKINKFVK